MSEFFVNGLVLSNTEYALAGYPKTDDVVAGEVRAWEEWNAECARQEHEYYLRRGSLPLSCAICGEWAGEVLTDDIHNHDVNNATLAVMSPKALCPSHHNTWQGRFKPLSAEEYIAMEKGK